MNRMSNSKHMSSALLLGIIARKDGWKGREALALRGLEMLENVKEIEYVRRRGGKGLWLARHLQKKEGEGGGAKVPGDHDLMLLRSHRAQKMVSSFSRLCLCGDPIKSLVLC